MYAKASRQVVNQDKSQIVFSHVKARVKNQILGLLGINEWKIPYPYSGILVEKSLRSTLAWKSIGEKLDNKMEPWKSKWLSQARRIVMLKETLLAIPIYLMSFISLPSGA